MSYKIRQPYYIIGLASTMERSRGKPGHQDESRSSNHRMYFSLEEATEAASRRCRANREEVIIYKAMYRVEPAQNPVVRIDLSNGECEDV